MIFASFLSGILSKVGLYVAGGAIILALVLGTKFYISHLQAKNDQLTLELASKEATIEFLKKAAKIDADVKEHKDEIKKVIDSGDPARIKQLLDKLRNLSTQTNN